MTKLAIRNASVRFAVDGGEPVQALDDIDHVINGGEFTVALGASGCGKTTLLNLLAGFIKPSSGAIFLDEQQLDGPGRERGVVFQKHALLPWLNAMENVAFGPRLSGCSKRERTRIAREYLQMVALQESEMQPVYKLSGGMQQRVGLARALANDPEILLMDEPLGALDAFTREAIQTLILDIWNTTHKTVFFITHSVEEALFMGNRLLIMSPSPGRITETLEFDFCHRYLESRDARAIKSDPEFIAAREKVVKIIHEHSGITTSSQQPATTRAV